MTSNEPVGAWEAEDDTETAETIENAAKGELARLVARLKEAEDVAKEQSGEDHKPS